jgi:hypothetical protein
MPRTNLSKLAEKKEDIKEVIEEPVKVKETKPKKKVFEQSDGVMCRSVVQGGLYVRGPKTEMIYSFTDYGDESEIEYRDLVAMVRSKDKAVYEPRFIIEDKDFLNEYPAIEKFYSSQITNRDIREILNKPVNEMVEDIKKLPNGAVENLKSIAAKQVSSGNLDSISKIRALDELFGTDLNLLSDLLKDE